MKVTINSDDDLNYVFIEIGPIPSRDFSTVYELADSVASFLRTLSVTAILPDELSQTQENEIATVVERVGQALSEAEDALSKVSALDVDD